MTTLGDIKRRVQMALEDYSSNGKVNSRMGNISEDTDIRLNGAVDYVCRKIALSCPRLLNSTGRLPDVIWEDTPDSEEIGLNEVGCDALVFGTAAVVCPTAMPALQLRMQVQFEEILANAYNLVERGGQVRNSFYSGGRRRTVIH